MQKMIIDFDGVAVDHLTPLVQLYNEDCEDKPGYKKVEVKDINTWEMAELNCIDRADRLKYFEDDRFFDRLRFNEGFKAAVCRLNSQGKYEFILATMGTPENIRKKVEWFKKNIKDTGVNFRIIALDSRKNADKSSIDMSGAIFIDDKGSNLETSNAAKKIVFGPKKSWNDEFRGIRLTDWMDIEEYLIG